MSTNLIENSAFRWHGGMLYTAVLSMEAENVTLIGLDNEKAILFKNVEYMLKGGLALNVLLWGDKGAGKSSLVRSLAFKYASQRLRIIEFCDQDYYSIYELYRFIRENSKFYFIIYFDDVSFDESDERYRNFKSIIEGGLEEKPVNTIFVATSNRRHLITEKAMDTEDLYNRDASNEGTSLFARFGITLGFYPINQEKYLNIVEYYMNKMQIKVDDWQRKAVNYAVDRGGRSGRVAQQFIIYQLIDSMQQEY